MATNEYARTKATIRGTMWYYIGYISGRVVAFVSMLILARILSQDDFGVAAYASIVIGFIDVIAGLGISNAVIYNKEEDGIADTAFWLNLASSLVIFTLAWFTAPLLNLAFNDARASEVFRILIIIYPISAFGYIQNALLEKKLSFGRRFIPSLTGALSKALISIPMALGGFGPMSIIVGQVGGELATTITYWLVLPWRPKFYFNKKFVKPLLSYGLNSVALEVLSVALNQVDFFLVGRILGSAMLGVYSLAFRIPEILIQMLCSAVATVIFPIFTSVQNDAETIKRGFLKTTQYLFLIVVPLGLGLALVAHPLVLCFLSEKWIAAIPVIRAITIFSTINSALYSAGVVFKAQGKQIVLTTISICQFLVVAPLLWWVTTTYRSIVYVGWAQVFVAFLVAVITLIVSTRLIDVTVMEILDALSTAVIPGVVMSILVFGVLYLLRSSSPWTQLLGSIPTGAIAYGATLSVFKPEVMTQIKQIIKTILQKK